MNVFTWPVRVYFEDTDMAGVVYYANYLKFMERARTEWLRYLGFEQDRLRADDRLVFAVRSAAVDYLSPARFNDTLEVESCVTRAGNASIAFAQEVLRCEAGKRSLLARGHIKVACLDAETFKPAAMPRVLLEAIASVC